MTNQSIPVLMEKQDFVFNGDTKIEKEFLALRDRFNIKTVIETGTFIGTTTIWLSQNFEQVYSIEVSKEYASCAIDRLKNSGNKNWKIIIGKSEIELQRVLESLKEKKNILIYLDAHWNQFCPLERELEIISQVGVKPVIAIHDFFVPDRPQFGFDSYNGKDFTFEWLKPSFDKIYGEKNYEYYYNTEVCENSAKRGIIYLLPKNIVIR